MPLPPGSACCPLIYHAFNQDHQDPEIRAALEAIRPLAQRFIYNYRSDATPLRVD